jgi:RNA-binding protein YhbY
MVVKEIQLGKNGITDNFIETLKSHFTKCRTVKVSVLASARESREDVKKYSNILLNKLGVYFTAKIIGFTIILKKWRKPRKEE